MTDRRTDGQREKDRLRDEKLWTSIYNLLFMGPSFLEGGPIMYRCCPSVCLSVCPVPPPRGKTKRPMKTKLGRKGPWDTSTPWTNFKVKGSRVKVTAANCAVCKKSP